MTSSHEPHDFLFTDETEADDGEVEAGPRHPPTPENRSYLGWIGARSRSVFGIGPAATAAGAGAEPGADEPQSEIERVGGGAQGARLWEPGSGSASQGRGGPSPAPRFGPQGTTGVYGEDAEDLHLLGAADYAHPAHASSGLPAGGDASSQGPAQAHWPQSYRQSMDWYSYMPSPSIPNILSPLLGPRERGLERDDFGAPDPAGPGAPSAQAPGPGSAAVGLGAARGFRSSNPIPTRGGAGPSAGGPWGPPKRGKPPTPGPEAASYPVKGPQRVRRRRRAPSKGEAGGEQQSWQQGMMLRQQRFLLPSPSYIMPFGSLGPSLGPGGARERESQRGQGRGDSGLHTPLLPDPQAQGLPAGAQGTLPGQGVSAESARVSPGIKLLLADKQQPQQHKPVQLQGQPPAASATRPDLTSVQADGKEGEGADAYDGEGEEGAEYDGEEGAEWDYEEGPYYLEGPRCGCSFTQAVLNGVNVLAGVGVLSTPYALMQAGWGGLVLLLLLAVVCCYTGLLLRSCLDARPGLETYPDIGEAAFGSVGRFFISIVLYVELYACCVEFLILEGDNLGAIFPHFALPLPLLDQLPSSTAFVLVAALCILPTVYLKDLSILSYVSAGGVMASLLVVLAVLWLGVTEVGFHSPATPLINPPGLPVAIGLFGFCYSGHAVFPNIYTSMANPKQFTAVLLVSFVVCTSLYGGMAVMGFCMFGQDLQSQITLNLPPQLAASRLAIWTTVVNPFTKYAISMTPVAFCLEELLPLHPSAPSYHTASLLIRTALVVSTVAVALLIPFFGYVMAFIGSFLSMTVSIILPCACYLRLLGNKATVAQSLVCHAIIAFGAACAVAGTYSSIQGIVSSLHGGG